MPTLNWIGKEAVINHHLEVPFHLLKDVPELSCGDPGSGNLIVEGDNLVGLKALLPYYKGKVKCVCIDPPYNTGVDERDEKGTRTGWVYSDNISNPVAQAWLNKVVGPEAEDLSRHDKWLCMIYPRLMLLKEMLRDDGVIFANIDENEYANLRQIMDEVFGIPNRVGTIIWHNATDNNPTNIAIEHEYVLCYARNKARLPNIWKSPNLAVKQKLLAIGDEFVRKFPDANSRQAEYSTWFRKHKVELWPFQDYKFIDDGGIYTGMRSVHNPGKEGYRYAVYHEVTGKECDQPMMGWRFPEATMKKLIEQKRIIFGETEKKLIELKVYVKDYRAKLASLFELDGRVGTNEIKDIFPESNRPFDFPKPTDLIQELVSFTTQGDEIVMDAFGGSGTTGDAVLRLNTLDDQRRRFVLVEMKEKIAQEITRERVKRVAEGYTNSKGEAVPGLGGGFRYVRLGDELFDEHGRINETKVRFADLARHVYFSEAGEPLPKGRISAKTPLLGVHQGRAVYLLYNGILKDKSVDGGNVLTTTTLDHLPAHDGPKVVYAAGCRFSKARLEREGITFKQTPYAIRTR
jgi:adenine-specific DNA-methyltransferase